MAGVKEQPSRSAARRAKRGAVLQTIASLVEAARGAKRGAVLRTIAILAGAALAIYILIGLLLAGKDTPLLSPNNQPMLIMGGEVSNHRVSTKSWSFEYTKAQLTPDGSFAKLDGLHNGIFYKHGKPLVRVSAEHATLNTNSYDFTATGKVHIERIGTDQSFDTDLITWSNATKLLQFNHPSYFHTGNQILKIERATFDLKNGTVSIGAINGSITL